MQTQPLIPVTYWNVIRLIYLNMWVDRPRIVILGAFAAACVPAVQIFFHCSTYGVGAALTTFFTALPFFVWFVIVPLVLYLIDYKRDSQLPIEQRRLQKVENYMLTHAIIERASRR